MTHGDAQALLDDARKVAQNAHAPYSQFKVGAVAVDADGNHHVGVNVENAAYGSTICAEAHAIAAAVSGGARKVDTVAVVSLNGPECYPCGNCRQVMREFDVDEVIVEAPGGVPRIHTLDEVYPLDFGPEDLGEKR